MHNHFKQSWNQSILEVWSKSGFTEQSEVRGWAGWRRWVFCLALNAIQGLAESTKLESEFQSLETGHPAGSPGRQVVLSYPGWFSWKYAVLWLCTLAHWSVFFVYNIDPSLWNGFSCLYMLLGGWWLSKDTFSWKWWLESPSFFLQA